MEMCSWPRRVSPGHAYRLDVDSAEERAHPLGGIRRERRVRI